MLKLDTEIRKIPPRQSYYLVKLLDICSSWKELMVVIPRDLNNPTELRYSDEHIRLIEDEFIIQKRSCSAIFLEDWGVSGPVKPNIGHLLQQLKKAELYQAWNYVIIHLLKDQPEVRQIHGPPVDTNFPNLHCYKPDTELRNLSPRTTEDLAIVLDRCNAWKKLIVIIPKHFDGSSPLRYKNNVIRLIEDISSRRKCSCAEILLENWSSSGPVRPNLGQLLQLLKKAKLYLAADYVSLFLMAEATTEDTNMASEFFSKMWLSFKSLFNNS